MKWVNSHGGDEWTWHNGPVKVSMHRHIDEPGRYFVTCYVLDIQKTPLPRGLSAEESLPLAEYVVFRRARALYEAVAAWKTKENEE